MNKDKALEDCERETNTLAGLVFQGDWCVTHESAWDEAPLCDYASGLREGLGLSAESVVLADLFKEMRKYHFELAGLCHHCWTGQEWPCVTEQILVAAEKKLEFPEEEKDA